MNVSTSSLPAGPHAPATAAVSAEVANAGHRDALKAARLYLCTDARRAHGDFAEFVDAAFAGGVDIIQLRDKTIEAAEELDLLAVLKEAAVRHGRLWAVNDRADIAVLSGAPVFHIGQKDLPLPAARTLVDGNAAIGLSSHTSEQVDAALAATAAPSGLDYFCVGPVWATPTKPGRAAVGPELVKYAAEASRQAADPVPWFAIGGIDHGNVREVAEAGARRIVVVRAITEAPDPAAAAASLLGALDAAGS
ncbi:thiamine phosphate synthase [Arthrobacter sp. ISL-85]|uniref:thiamine phosphate synthase n=1 Tax=Arthrobacter sp. ISL-85 TaxID=2819115 RepID=UPI001BEB0058|nr:thiamine phosphate synthase [Arthrobacter sp. ISL-85]MBT2566464.1 thiamine phosphate synthase [Arthrobacter sp. ISL-85]